MNARIFSFLVAPAVLAAAGCGGGSGGTHASSTPSSTTTAVPPATTQHTTAGTGTAAAPGALQAESASAATGDIPDNQVYLLFRSSGGWTMKYPEGWAQSGSPKATVFRDKNNIARVVVQKGAAPTSAQVQAQLRALGGVRIQSGPKPINLGGGHGSKVVYTTQSTPNAVTGKRVTLTVDRYYVSQGGRLAIVDLGTPVGVDNVDAYRLMIESFRWK